MDSMNTFRTLTEDVLPTGLGTAENFEMCPTMDLISFQLDTSTLWIYRLNNEKVWDISLDLDDARNESIAKLCWRPDGKLFAVISNIGRINLFDANNGRSIMEFSVWDKGIHEVEACSWSNRREDSDKNKPSRFREFTDFSELFDIHLPYSLAKLSNQKLINDDEFIRCDNSLLDFLIVGSSGGHLSLILSGVFTVEDYQLPVTSGKILTILSNEDLTSHYILIDTKDVSQAHSLTMVKLDTDFVSRYGSKLPLISHTCSRLVGLISCLKESIDHMNTDYKPFADYTTRIIDLLKGEIDEKNQKDYSDDPVYDLYDLLLTGSLSDATRTWLTDYLGDRGIKRWVKLGRQHFEGSRKTMFYDMIPALQHLLVHLSSLQGLSKWEETTDLLGLDSNKINTSIETASTFLKACYKTMMTLNEEQKNFESVMEWLDAIVQEVMTDEKPTIQIKTQNIIQFLLSIFNKSGARQKNGDLQVLFDSLSSDLVGIFQKIKDKMKSQMSSELAAVLAEDTEGMIYWEAKLFGEFGILAVSSREKIELVKFDIDSLKSNKTILEGVGNPQSLLASLMEDGSNIIVLESYEREARLALLRLGEESTNSILEGNAAMVKSITLPEEEGTVATYITNNSKRQTCCLLDSTRKRYIVLEY